MGVEPANCVIRDADNISEAISSYARQNDYDVIFIDHDGGSCKLKCVIGSIMTSLLELAHCSVTVIHE